MFCAEWGTVSGTVALSSPLKVHCYEVNRKGSEAESQMVPHGNSQATLLDNVTRTYHMVTRIP